MLIRIRFARAFGSLAAVTVFAACASDAPTTTSVSPRAPAFAAAAAHSIQSDALPTGERQFGKESIEPAYDDVTGSIIYLLTPEKAPLPSKANQKATAPLYLVEYPPGSTVGTLDCMGVPGNCPDHDGNVAGFAVGMMPNVYGTNPSLVPGHDHLVAPPASGGDFNVAWEVIEVLFTNNAAANTRLVTEDDVENAIRAGNAKAFDLGFAFNCSVVPAATYWHGTPVG